MKNKRMISVIISLALFGIGLWYFWDNSSEQTSKEVVESAQTEKPIAHKEADKKSIAQSIAEYIKKPDADTRVVARIKKIQKFQSLKMGKFDYYGKVIDQHGEPVVGITIDADIGYYPLIPNGNFYPSHKIKRLTTDAEGRFSIVGEKGESVDINHTPNSEYEFWYPKLAGFTFSRVGVEGLKKVGNPDKPVIFKAWKKTESEGLFFDEAQINFAPSGTTYAIDLYHWSKVINGNTGDVRVSCKRPLNLKREHPPFDWEFIITAIDGGIIEANDIFMNEAPETGYHSEWKLTMDETSENWSSRASKKFYLKSRNGDMYGRLEFRIIPIYNENCRIIAKWWLNLNGSRNLQDDPAKRIYSK